MWFKSPGRLPVDNSFDSSLLDACIALKTKIISNKGLDCKAEDIKDFQPQQILKFLDLLQDEEKSCQTAMKDTELLQKLDMLYEFSKSGNAEVKWRWFTLCIKAEKVFHLLHVFITITFP
eukprot:m.216022 g.216022  ORF g.216022 m.216022 type:complete len:120 (-) comp15877_c0_seq51:1250-1609(-)